jgi:hypothetical protein
MATPVMKSFAHNPAFTKTAHRTAFAQAIYYEPIQPVSFRTRVERQTSDTLEVEKEIKDSKTVFYLFGFIPLGLTYTYKVEKQTVNTSSFFCELTTEMNAWVDSIKPYCQDLIRHRGKLEFRPTDEELNTKCELTVAPFVVEYGGMTGIGWKRSVAPVENLPA